MSSPVKYMENLLSCVFCMAAMAYLQLSSIIVNYLHSCESFLERVNIPDMKHWGLVASHFERCEGWCQSELITGLFIWRMSLLQGIPFGFEISVSQSVSQNQLVDHDFIISKTIFWFYTRFSDTNIICSVSKSNDIYIYTHCYSISPLSHGLLLKSLFISKFDRLILLDTRHSTALFVCQVPLEKVLDCLDKSSIDHSLFICSQWFIRPNLGC